MKFNSQDLAELASEFAQALRLEYTPFCDSLPILPSFPNKGESARPDSLELLSYSPKKNPLSSTRKHDPSHDPSKNALASSDPLFAAKPLAPIALKEELPPIFVVSPVLRVFIL